MRRLLTVTGLLIVAIISGLCVFMSSDTYLIDHTIANSKEILAQFKLADAKGAMATGDGAYQVFVSPIDTAQCDKETFQKQRKAAGDKELFMIWRGEWMECYSSVSKTSTLTFDRNAYSALGSLLFDRVVFGLLGLASLLAAIWLIVISFKSRQRMQSIPQPKP